MHCFLNCSEKYYVLLSQTTDRCQLFNVFVRRAEAGQSDLLRELRKLRIGQ